MNGENITSSVYLAAKAHARLTDAGKEELRRLRSYLEANPKTQERLAVEIISTTLQSLNRGESPRGTLAAVVPFLSSITDAQMPECLDLLQKIVVRSFDRIVQVASDKNEVLAHEFTFGTALIAIHHRNPRQAKLLHESLMRTVSAKEDSRKKILLKFGRLLKKTGISDGGPGAETS
jgi:hypothetical protein